MSFFQTLFALFDQSNMSAFGTLETNRLTPMIQLDFVYGVNTRTSKNSGSGTGATVTFATRLASVASGTSNDGYALLQSISSAKYRPGQGVTARFTTIFGTGTALNKQYSGMATISSGAPYDGYLWGYSGISFGIWSFVGGSGTFVASSSFNGDILDGTGKSSFTINPQKGNVYMIKYPYLGFGNIEFFVQDSATSRWILAHTIKYTNANTATALTNPNLGFILQSRNDHTGTTSVTASVGSVGVFLSGERSFDTYPSWGTDNSKTAITTETCLLNVKNCTTYNTFTNQSQLRLTVLSVAANNNSGNDIATFRIKINATIGGSPSYTPINGSTGDGGTTLTSANSVASVDTAGTTVANGTLEVSVVVSTAGGSQVVDLSKYNIFINPGDVVTVSGASTGSAALGAGLAWEEDI